MYQLVKTLGMVMELQSKIIICYISSVLKKKMCLTSYFIKITFMHAYQFVLSTACLSIDDNEL